MRRWLCRAFLLAAVLVLAPSARAAEKVDLLLVLASDVSRSGDAEKFKLQREGYAAAISDKRVLDAVSAGRNKRIAVLFLEWSGNGNQKVVIDWTPIDGPKAAQEFGWGKGQKAPAGRGYGFAFARYKNLAAYCAIACEVEVNRETGRPRLVRAVAAVDSGQVVNPDGLINQIEGAIVQSMSWTLYEAVSFDDTRITSIDWQTYPILRFDAVPDRIAVHLINRPGKPFLGSGETGQGPAAASIANAIADATGKRLRDLPLTRRKIKAAIEA